MVRPPPFTSLQSTIDDLKRLVKDGTTCMHDVLKPGTSESAVILGILE